MMEAMLRVCSLVFATYIFAFAFDADTRRQDAHCNVQCQDMLYIYVMPTSALLAITPC